MSNHVKQIIREYYRQFYRMEPVSEIEEQAAREVLVTRGEYPGEDCVFMRTRAMQQQNIYPFQIVIYYLPSIECMIEQCHTHEWLLTIAHRRVTVGESSSEEPDTRVALCAAIVAEWARLKQGMKQE